MQTSVKMNMDAARAGMFAHAFNPSAVRTLAAEGALPFGYGAVAGTSAKQAKVPASSADKFVGVVAMTQALESQSGAAAAGYADDKAANIATFGEMWVVTTGTIAVGDTLYVVSTGANAGKLTATATSNIATGLKVRALDATLGLALAVFTAAV